MPKMKSNKGAVKRFSQTGSGGYKCKHSHLRHILTKKNRSRKRALRAPDMIDKADLVLVKKMLPYG